MENLAEVWLRNWLRREWQVDVWGDLVWQEAARGGTEGAPDVWVPNGQRWSPVELKAWKVGRGGAPQFSARPAQRRFHRRARMSGQYSAFLAVLGDGRIIAVPNWAVPASGTQVLSFRKISGVIELRATLQDESFWEG